ncbi:hypothetical protein BDV95DRAFT_257919 [Massariosphaeria phaeospora]|uniref:Uncharacterized protein n=1 Tax=Massariosphaeria phaeospora TaxID=100035 RepID=A0A7C8M6W1_9PLEO|nr:hypothetical protein BDV95DRAFT_257919 [Massariosphaeria phaeospora]
MGSLDRGCGGYIAPQAQGGRPVATRHGFWRLSVVGRAQSGARRWFRAAARRPGCRRRIMDGDGALARTARLGARRRRAAEQTAASQWRIFLGFGRAAVLYLSGTFAAACCLLLRHGAAVRSRTGPAVETLPRSVLSSRRGEYLAGAYETLRVRRPWSWIAGDRGAAQVWVAGWGGARECSVLGTPRLPHLHTRRWDVSLLRSSTSIHPVCPAACNRETCETCDT